MICCMNFKMLKAYKPLKLEMAANIQELLNKTNCKSKLLKKNIRKSAKEGIFIVVPPFNALTKLNKTTCYRLYYSPIFWRQYLINISLREDNQSTF
ncbi:hypothetical protein DOY81_009190 [Sarcophaga bullata]|nr:hypothetical protein DOY81_009190 [Sarcophaga bullata]